MEEAKERGREEGGRREEGRDKMRGKGERQMIKANDIHTSQAHT